MQSTVAVYNNRVFGGWDYAITNPKAAIVKKANLRREFKVGKPLLKLRQCMKINIKMSCGPSKDR